MCVQLTALPSPGLDIAPKRVEKKRELAERTDAKKTLGKRVEAAFASRVGGSGADLSLKYEEVKEKPKKKGHR